MKGHVRKRCTCTPEQRKKCKHPWAFVIDVGRDDVTGKRKQKWKSGFRTRAEAEQAMREALADLDGGRDPFPKKMTVRDFFTQWLKHWETQVRPKTLAGYRTLVHEHVLPVIGNLRMDVVRPAHIINVLGEMDRKGRSLTTQVHAHAVMNKAFGTAAKWRVIASNPVRDTERPKAESPDHVPPTSEQLLRLLEVAAGTRWEVALLLSVATGARRSEVLAVRWSDIDLERRRMYIRRSLQQLGKEIYFAQPKTYRSRRPIALPPFAVERLRDFNRAQKKRRLELGNAWRGNRDHEHDLVCDDGFGQPLRPDSYTDWYRRRAQELGFPTKRLHDVRKAYGTILFEQNVNPNITSKALGHSRPEFTMRVYQHVADSMTDLAADAIEAVFSPEAFADRLHQDGS
jgi:integrase